MALRLPLIFGLGSVIFMSFLTGLPSLAAQTTGIQGTPAQYVSVIGVMTVFHYDDFDQRQATNTYALDDGTSTYRVVFASGEPSVRSGSTVKLSGILSEGTITVLSPTLSSEFEVLGEPPLFSLGEQRTIVILVNFEDYPGTSGLTTQSVYQDFFGDPASVDAFFREVSYGRTWLSGNVVGWYTLPGNLICNPEGIGAAYQAAIAAADPDVFFPDYRHIYFLFRQNVCGGGAHGVVTAVTDDGPIEKSASYTLGRFDIPTGHIGRGTEAHEMGHAVGLPHANGWNCPSGHFDPGFPYDPACHQEYGNPFDRMGVGPLAHFNARYKEQSGWLDPDQIIDVDIGTESGTFTIEPLEVNSSAPKAIRIHRGSASPTFYVEYRRPIGFDSSLSWPGAVLDGAMINIYSPGYPDTKLVDATPGTAPPGPDHYDAVLPLAATFKDPLAGLSLTTASMSGNELAVTIDEIPQTQQPEAPDVHAVATSANEVSAFVPWVYGATSYRLISVSLARPYAPLTSEGETSIPWLLDEPAACTPEPCTTVVRYWVRSIYPGGLASRTSQPVDVDMSLLPDLSSSLNDTDFDGCNDAEEISMNGQNPINPLDFPDLVQDGSIDAMDTQAIAFRWGSRPISPFYGVYFDRWGTPAPDGVIDIRDLQLVYGRFSRTCAGA
ncbi:MAG: flexitail domain-containing putative surface protein [Dehalococcoidia bacterium]